MAFSICASFLLLIMAQPCVCYWKRNIPPSCFSVKSSYLEVETISHWLFRNQIRQVSTEKENGNANHSKGWHARIWELSGAEVGAGRIRVEGRRVVPEC